MRLILHIGTHKTGTSSLQQFLRNNEDILAEKGIYYARIAGTKNANRLAKWVIFKQRKKVESFFEEHMKRACSANAHTVLISAESFYAMTKNFLQFKDNQVADYWASETEAVNFLRSVLPAETKIKIVTYFRRQDRFIESYYSQAIKTHSVTSSIDEFRYFMNEALNYWCHMKIWNAVFPGCCAYTYESVSSNITEQFCREILGLQNVNQFESPDLRMNVRISRDLIEYKRMLNRQEKSPIERYMNSIAFTQLSRTLPDDGKYTDYFTPVAREALLQELEENNGLLRVYFSMPAFPALSNEERNDRAPYPGLSAGKAEEIARLHRRMTRSTGYQIDRLGLLAARFIRKRLTFMAWIISPARSLLGRQKIQWLNAR